MKNVPLDESAAEAHLMNFLGVEGITGEEKAIGEAVTAALQRAGVPAAAIRFDSTHKKIPLPTQTGNLIVELPGRLRETGCFSRAIWIRSRSVPASNRCARGPDRHRRQHRARRRCAYGVRGDRRDGRDTAKAPAAASAAHPAVHGPRGERPARRARARPQGLRGRQDVLQRGHHSREHAAHRRCRPGKLGGGDQGQGVACRSGPGKGDIRHAHRIDRTRRSASRRLVRQGHEARGRGTSNVGVFGARTEKRPAMPPTSSPTTSTSSAKRAATMPRSLRTSRRATAKPS